MSEKLIPFKLSMGYSHHLNSNNCSLMRSSNLYLICFAGIPPTIEYGSTSFTTTAPAAIIEPSPTLMPEEIKALVPI